MKKYLFMAAAVFSTIAAVSQDKKEAGVKPSAVAEAAFKKAWPAAGKVKWSKEDGDFEVNFKNTGREMSAVYTAGGMLKETEEEVAKTELPAAAASYTKQHYKGSIKNVAKITDAKGIITYEVEIGETEVFFDGSGKFIKEVTEEKEEKDGKAEK